MLKKHGFAQGIALKKDYGQHFLRDDSVAQKIVMAVDLLDKHPCQYYTVVKVRNNSVV